MASAGKPLSREQRIARLKVLRGKLIKAEDSLGHEAKVARLLRQIRKLQRD